MRKNDNNMKLYVGKEGKDFWESIECGPSVRDMGEPSGQLSYISYKMFNFDLFVWESYYYY